MKKEDDTWATAYSHFVSHREKHRGTPQNLNKTGGKREKPCSAVLGDMHWALQPTRTAQTDKKLDNFFDNCAGTCSKLSTTIVSISSAGFVTHPFSRLHPSLVCKFWSPLCDPHYHLPVSVYFSVFAQEQYFSAQCFFFFSRLQSHQTDCLSAVWERNRVCEIRGQRCLKINDSSSFAGKRKHWMTVRGWWCVTLVIVNIYCVRFYVCLLSHF